MRCASNSVGLTEVDARGVQPDGCDASVVDEPLRRVGVQTGKVEQRDRVRSTRVRAHVAHAIRPERRVAGPKQNERAVWDRAMLGLPRLEIGDRHLVVRIRQRCLAHIDDDARPDQVSERNLIDRPPPFGEVNRRVQVRAAVLRRRERERLVVIAAVGHALRVDVQFEALLGRPIDRVLVVRMAQIDEGAAGKRSDNGRFGGWLARGDGEQNDEKRGGTAHDEMYVKAGCPRILKAQRVGNLRCPYRMCAPQSYF